MKIITSKDQLKEIERSCLEDLAYFYGGSEGDCCIPFKTMMGKKYTYKEVRRAVRSLARKGLAKYFRGLMTDDGELAGSGYSATQEGFDLINPEKGE